MITAGPTQQFASELGLAVDSYACVLCLRSLKATSPNSITAF